MSRKNYEVTNGLLIFEARYNPEDVVIYGGAICVGCKDDLSKKDYDRLVELNWFEWNAGDWRFELRDLDNEEDEDV